MFDSNHLVYAAAGAVAFSILGAVAAYYRDDRPSKKSVARDFVAGSLMVSFVMLLMPGMFPELSFKVPLPDIHDVVMRNAAFSTQKGGGGNGASEYDLQLQF